jgi:hypothetical protein
MFGGMQVNVIACLSNGEERSISFDNEEELVPAIARKLGVNSSRLSVSFTDNIVGNGLTAEDCGIVNNSRLTITVNKISTKTQFRGIIDDICNHPRNQILGLDPEYLMSRVESTKDTDDLVNIDFSSFELNALPESFEYLIIVGDLALDSNFLRLLPTNFHTITIGGSLFLHYNQLQTLPQYFENMQFNNTLRLDNNPNLVLPENFSNIVVARDLFISRIGIPPTQLPHFPYVGRIHM